MFKASLETKCFNFSIRISSQSKLVSGHLVTASFFFVLMLYSLITFTPQDGHLFGKLNFLEPLLLFDLSTYNTCGITSPAL